MSNLTTPTRRTFLQGSVAATAAAMMPFGFGELIAGAAPLGPTERILVTIYLNGGNDALNTLIPEGGAYVDARGGLAVPIGDHTAIGGGLHLNPALASLRQRYLGGDVALLPGIGDVHDDHSHFTSTATWMSAQPPNSNRTGWMGRWVDGTDPGSLASASFGWTGVPLLMRGAAHTAAALPEGGALFGADREQDFRRLPIEALENLPATGPAPFGPALALTTATAVDAAVDVQPIFGSTALPAGFPRRMALAAALLNEDLGARAIAILQDGYDTHDSQEPTHTQLLSDLDLGIETFFQMLTPSMAARTAVVVVSEFGRRVAPSGSLGTDHGAAGLAMVIGSGVNGGVRSDMPSITDLDARGDLHHTVDFRQLYTTVLDDWLGADGVEILGANHAALDLFTASPPDGGGSGFPPASSRFTDVPDGTWYSTPVAWMAATGITTGTTPTTFSPHDPLTRGQTATFLHRYNGSPGGAPPSGFVDVPAGSYFEHPIDWLASTGITTGTSATTFSPDATLTRAQLATFLWRMEGELGAPTSPFVDVERPSYYAAAVDWLAQSGITTGTSPTTFSPGDPVTRAQIATFLWRLAGEPTTAG